MAKYSKDKFIKERKITVPFPEIYKEDEDPIEDAVFTVSAKTQADLETVNDWFFGQTAKEREDPAIILDFIIKSACAALTKEPYGFDDFPKDKKRSLYERAYAYFTGNEPDEQNLYNEMLSYVYTQHATVLVKNTFTVLSDDNAGKADI